MGDPKKGLGWAASFLPPVISGAANILGGVIGREQSRRDIDRQNAYNSPLQQVQRTLEAGLPMAFLEGGHAGSQSALPESSGQGIAAGGDRLANYIASQMQLKQLDLLDAQIDKSRAEADEAVGRTKWLGTVDTQRWKDNAFTNQERQLDAALGQEEVQKTLKDNEQLMSDMNYMYENGIYEDGQKRKMFDAQLDKILEELSNIKVHGKLLNEELTSVRDMVKAKHDIYSMMKSGRFPSLSAILYTIMMGVTKVSSFKY